jgi:hypothetical protein
VPPVTALRSPPDSRITGADSPVTADSSTEAIPSITVPSPGISSPASTTTTSPRRSSDAGFSPPSRSRAIVSVRIARRDAAWALPRPSASASARLANTTVSHSQIVTLKVNHAGSSPPPSGAPPKACFSQPKVVMTAPISTTSITGLCHWTRGSSFTRLAHSACRSTGPVNRLWADLVMAPPDPQRDSARARSRQARRARPARGSPCCHPRAGAPGRAGDRAPRPLAAPGCARWPARCEGRRRRRSSAPRPAARRRPGGRD